MIIIIILFSFEILVFVKVTIKSIYITIIKNKILNPIIVIANA